MIDPEPIEAARRAIQRSDRFQGTGAELSALRDALRALTDFVSILNVRLQGVESRPQRYDGPLA